MPGFTHGQVKTTLHIDVGRQYAGREVVADGGVALQLLGQCVLGAHLGTQRSCRSGITAASLFLGLLDLSL